jgi:transcriptional regulator with XRE-family HTH domain
MPRHHRGMKHPLTRFRKEKSLTMLELAEKTGIDKSILSRIETRKRNASIEQIRRLVTFADGGLSADDFVFPEISEQPGK